MAEVLTEIQDGSTVKMTEDPRWQSSLRESKMAVYSKQTGCPGTQNSGWPRIANVDSGANMDTRWQIPRWRPVTTKMVTMDTDRMHAGNQEARSGGAHGKDGGETQS